MAEDYMHNKIAHTAEHAFIGSLQRLMDKKINVRKVEHQEFNNRIFITIPNLDLEVVVKAESEVNSLISQGRTIKIHSFESLNEAKKYLPNMRANETRIKADSVVRVVEIEGHDVAACSMEHAENLIDCKLFLITKISKNGQDYEINFVIDEQAKKTAIELSLKIIRICAETGSNYNTVENTVRKLKMENQLYLDKLRNITEEKLNSILPQMVHYVNNDNNNIILTVISAIFTGLGDEEIRTFAGKKINDSANTVVVIANLNYNSNQDDDDDKDTANIVFARSKSLSNIDCNAIFRQLVSSEYGAGGGKPYFVTGVVKKNKIKEIVDKIIYQITNR